jgi:hypothetical protein
MWKNLRAAFARRRQAGFSPKNNENYVDDAEGTRQVVGCRRQAYQI